MIREKIIKLIENVVEEKNIELEVPENPFYGDYSTNIALKFKKDPLEIVKKLKSPLFRKVEVAGPGFINFWLSKQELFNSLEKILKEKEKYGSCLLYTSPSPRD